METLSPEAIAPVVETTGGNNRTLLGTDVDTLACADVDTGVADGATDTLGGVGEPWVCTLGGVGELWPCTLGGVGEPWPWPRY